MAKKEVKPFLLRIDPRVLAAVQRWAEEDLRSLNGQIEFILRQASRETRGETRGGAAVRRGAGRRRLTHRFRRDSHLFVL